MRKQEQFCGYSKVKEKEIANSLGARIKQLAEAPSYSWRIEIRAECYRRDYVSVNSTTNISKESAKVTFPVFASSSISNSLL